MAGKRATLKYEREYYFPEAYESGVLTPAEARAEYNRLRRIANRRLKSFEGTRFEEWNIYRSNAGRFAAPGSKISERDLGKALYDVMRFVQSAASTKTGARAIEKKQAATLRAHGVREISAANINVFGEFMKAAREYEGASSSKTWDSERPLEMFQAAVTHGANPLDMTRTLKQYQYWRENVEALQQLPRHQGKRSTSAASYKREINAFRRSLEQLHEADE